jgi:propanol-preferring alcohol dehydrogenase
MVLDEFGGKLRLEERPAPEPSGDGTLVRITAAGVCHSDLHVVDGHFSTTPLPLVLGHEIAGEAGDLGPVLLYTPWGCGECRFCAAGEEMICPNGRELGLFQDGGYAEYVAVPHRRYLFPIGELDPVQAAPLCCGGLTAYRAVKHSRPWLAPGARALVIGAGGLGQYAIQYLRLMSDAAVWVADVSSRKRARALELGAELAVSPDELEGPIEAVLDFVGSDETLALGAAAVDRKGFLAVVGLFNGRIPFGLGAVPHEAHFMSSIWGSLEDFGELVALAQREPLQYTVEALPLEQAQDAHDRLRRGEAEGRLVLVP